MFENMTTDNVNGHITSFMQLESGSQISVTASTISQVFNFATGAVLHGKEADSEMTFNNTSFLQNSAMEGALFNIEQSSMVKIYDSKAQYNFAPSTAIIVAEDNGRFEMYNSTFLENYAARIYFGSLSVVTSSAVIDNCTFDGYDEMTPEIILDLIPQSSPGCLQLCHLPDLMKTYLYDNQATWNQGHEAVLLKMILSEITITKSKFINQGSFVDAFVSTIFLTENEFLDTTVSSNIMSVTGTVLNFEGNLIQNVSHTALTYSFLFCTMDSVINVNNLVVNSSRIHLFSLESSEFFAYDVNVVSSSSVGRIFNFLDMKNVIMQDWIIDGFTPGSNYVAIDARQSHIALWRNVSIVSLSLHVLRFTEVT